jgi:hypothetical protein
MTGVMLITQSPPVPAVVQGAYRWLWPGNEPDTYWQNERGWGCEAPALSQYELFAEEFCIDSGAVFRQLVDEWRAERGARSSTTEILLSRAYQSIIGLGEKAVPLILAEMESEGDDPDQWFYALQVLTHANPVIEDDEGDFQAMARAWINWARRRYVW